MCVSARLNRSHGIVAPAWRLSGCASISARWRAIGPRSMLVASTMAVEFTDFTDFFKSIRYAPPNRCRYMSRQDDGGGEDAGPAFVGTCVAAARPPLYVDTVVLSPPCLTRSASLCSSAAVAPTGPGSGQTRASAETHCPG